MFKVMLFTHGRLGEEMVNTSKLIMGEREDLEAYALTPGCNLDELRETLRRAICKTNENGQDVLVLTDLMYGTPFNIMLSLQDKCRFRHITGANLAMLTEVLNLRDGKSPAEASDEICKTAREGIVDTDDLIRLMEEG